MLIKSRVVAVAPPKRTVESYCFVHKQVLSGEPGGSVKGQVVEMEDTGEDDDGHDVSWVVVKPRDLKRRRVEGGGSVSIETQNRFEPLSVNVNNGTADNNVASEARAGTSSSAMVVEPVMKPPAFCLDGVSDVDGMVKKFTSLTGEKSFLVNTLADGTMKIAAETVAAYNILTKFCRDKKLMWHTYQPKNERSFNVVINGLHRSFKIDDLKHFLKNEGHIVRSASVMRRRVFDRDSETSMTVLMDKFIVHLEPQANNKEIYNVKYIDHCVVHIEPPHNKPKGPVQCTNCQRYGHTGNYCFRAPVCVKCGGPHHHSKCPLPRESKPKCGNCGEEHTANYKGCSVAQQQIQRRRQMIQLRQERQERQAPQFNLQENEFAQLPRSSNEEPKVRRDFVHSYAETTRDENFMSRMEKLMEQQVQTTNLLLSMMNQLMNVLCRK